MKHSHGFRCRWIPLAIAGAAAAPVAAEGPSASQAGDPPRLAPVVVTVPAMEGPGRVSTDPRQPRLPLPAHDGGAYLASIPGFVTSRKGGTSGDPALRGLGGSRLSLLLDDDPVLGGCGGRMDPPTAYAYPQAFDRIEVSKGPQSVRHGAVSGGTVRFERDAPVFTEAGEVTGFAGLTVGRFDRTDLVADVATGSSAGYLRAIGTFSDQDDYRDGDGNEVHSRYSRWSGTGIAGWRPDEQTLIEFTYDRSDAEAAYDDRGMDGVRFDRTGYSLALTRDDLAPWFETLEARVFRNEIDHVMDNYTLREPPGMPMVSYPERITEGARFAGDFRLPRGMALHAGVDYSRNRHSGNRLMGPDAFGWRDVAREDTARFRDAGVFGELEVPLDARRRVVGGLRVDRTRAEAQRDGFGGASDGDRERATATSGFLRYEQEQAQRPLAWHVGVGRSERAADFWERRRVFDLDTEVLTQLDTGIAWNGSRLRASLSGFYGEFDDYILVAQPGDRTRNVGARTWGFEADGAWEMTSAWTLNASAAWVRSENTTDDVPLAQTPPAEATLGAEYASGMHFGGLQVRGVMRQDRIHEDHGTIYSLDTGETSGFATVALYGGVELFGNSQLTVGVDNLFDRSYSEHIQRGSAELGAATRPVNEPGRTVWAQWNVEF